MIFLRKYKLYVLMAGIVVLMFGLAFYTRLTIVPIDEFIQREYSMNLRIVPLSLESIKEAQTNAQKTGLGDTSGISVESNPNKNVVAVKCLETVAYFNTVKLTKVEILKKYDAEQIDPSETICYVYEPVRILNNTHNNINKRLQSGDYVPMIKGKKYLLTLHKKIKSEFDDKPENNHFYISGMINKFPFAATLNKIGMDETEIKVSKEVLDTTLGEVDFDILVEDEKTKDWYIAYRKSVFDTYDIK